VEKGTLHNLSRFIFLNYPHIVQVIKCVRLAAVNIRLALIDSGEKEMLPPSFLLSSVISDIAPWIQMACSHVINSQSKEGLSPHYTLYRNEGQSRHLTVFCYIGWSRVC